MRGSLASKFETKKFRLKRRSPNILREFLNASALIGVISAITAAMIFGYIFIVSSTYFQIKETVVRGCKELTEKEILSLAALKPFQTLLSINPEGIRQRISQNPWVKEIFVGKELPGRLIIEVHERTAVALVKRLDGFYLLDLDGVIFKKLEEGESVDLPVLNGCYAEGKANTALFNKSLELLRYLSTSNNAFTIKHVSEIHGHEIFGLSLFTNDGLCLRLGFDSYENKIKRVAPVLDDLEKRNLKLGYLLIDVNNPTKIIVQRKDVLGPIVPMERKRAYRI